jgi:hypothetical protein
LGFAVAKCDVVDGHNCILPTVAVSQFPHGAMWLRLWAFLVVHCWLSNIVSGTGVPACSEGHTNATDWAGISLG